LHYVCTQERNSSGFKSVIVVSKTSGKYKEIKPLDVAFIDDEIKLLFDKVSTWISTFGGQHCFLRVM
jgi:hypothetical protein